MMETAGHTGLKTVRIKPDFRIMKISLTVKDNMAIANGSPPVFRQVILFRFAFLLTVHTRRFQSM